MAEDSSRLVAETFALAARHGLHLAGAVTFNETGLDFRVGFATDTAGRRWVLRIPRRDDVRPKIEREARILDFVKQRLPVEVPDWQVRGPDLVAYPMLTDPMALVFDAGTHAVTWNIDQGAEIYVTSLAEVLVALHASPVEEAVAAGIPASSPEEARIKVRQDLERVKQEIGIGRDLEARCRRWLDSDRLWPDFSVLTHGDLYIGHVTAAADARVSGVIDWTEAEISDPSIDFAGHLAAFSPESLERLVAAYELAGGRTWPAMVAHIEERHAASPIKYGIFAISTGNEQNLAAAKAQLGAG
ncbi:macrolide 2'-phosphotransferase [Pseudothauera nasutitermitis]|uniref:Macrolide 2'-phosphotransferase n=1 Tax=Pseudothauera nasutitermitis TaxID=2565930 RepID=A0A4S4B667_9RHOO|nr:macrolide 2'-phosphotransferase [Pseudothauera nasutitermitis]THF67316.1 macrolide 2'-phosphotransferase [Pseudothauera nasutitermitis]